MVSFTFVLEFERYRKLQHWSTLPPVWFLIWPLRPQDPSHSWNIWRGSHLRPLSQEVMLSGYLNDLLKVTHPSDATLELPGHSCTSFCPLGASSCSRGLRPLDSPTLAKPEGTGCCWSGWAAQGTQTSPVTQRPRRGARRHSCFYWGAGRANVPPSAFVLLCSHSFGGPAVGAGVCVCMHACVCAQLCGRASLQEASRQSGLSLPTDLGPGSAHTESAFQSFLGWTGTKRKLRIGWVVSLATWKHGWGRRRWEPERRE